MIKINGEPANEMAGKTVMEYLLASGYKRERVAVERNGEIVPKSTYEAVVLKDGDELEVVSFVGGG